ncbi:oxysterol-binding -related 9 isoform X7, partial [Brachionus plicatilis]
DLNNHQSVISHLLTQVRIGMDLTKITLPTFILETRSLLEMYADFFAHTDLFLRIAEIKNSHERMIQVVKWYLSTFHAGRKSPVPKKPYNPILGEVFQCWYDIPEYSSSDNANVCDGPIPWATKDQLTFVAEQVSHHPPISAFYAEHLDKRIQLDGYTWTKSKFLGLSIGVHMVGKAVLSLLDFNEEYEFTFPSAFGRSILTVPWFELGGQVTINCSKSGYSSNIDFVTKPFYGGKKHQIQGSIFGPDKKVLHTIEGEWNGTMFIKTGKKQEIFLSTNNAVSYKKKTRSLVEQLDNESRKLWKEVSYYLHTKQIELATDAKQRIEQKQRDESKLRKERNLKWKPRYFNEKGDNWVYINPLIKRLHNKI